MPNENLYLCLLDCSSIQRYVFGSNKLQTNIGASYIVEKIYNHWIPETLNALFPNDQTRGQFKNMEERFNYWRKKPEKIVLKEHSNLKWEIGYIGGGNALLLFRTKEDVGKFINAWTRNLLVEAPGIRPAVAWIETTWENLDPSIDTVFKELAKNKNSCLAETIIPRHGITAEDRLSGLSSEIFATVKGTTRPVSSVTKTKLDHYPDARDKIEEEYDDILEGQYKFSIDLEKLGQSKNVENHIAVVHIDGNNMGQHFEYCKTLVKKRQLSERVAQITQNAMRQTLKRLLEKMDDLKKEVLEWPKDTLDDEEESGKDKKQPLPLRPMILNGDDVTFISDARLGLFLAETYIKAFTAEEAPIPQKYFSACGGVAIVRTKYPFYRGYMLAEDLCKQAKLKGRQNETSWLDFHISYRGLSGSLPDIRQQYQTNSTSLLWRPWQITDEKNMFAFSQLKKAAYSFRHSDHPWPKSKLHEFATNLEQSKHNIKLLDGFLIRMQARGLDLPVIAQANSAYKTGWQGTNRKQVSPYYDVLEVMEFYPDCLFDKEDKS